MKIGQIYITLEHELDLYTELCNGDAGSENFNLFTLQNFLSSIRIKKNKKQNKQKQTITTTTPTKQKQNKIIPLWKCTTDLYRLAYTWNNLNIIRFNFYTYKCGYF